MGRQVRLTCSGLCRKKATYFGRFAGGVCETHALQLVTEHGIGHLHPESQERMLALPAYKGALQGSSARV